MVMLVGSNRSSQLLRGKRSILQLYEQLAKDSRCVSVIAQLLLTIEIWSVDILNYCNKAQSFMKSKETCGPSVVSYFVLKDRIYNRNSQFELAICIEIH